MDVPTDHVENADLTEQPVGADEGVMRIRTAGIQYRQAHKNRLSPLTLRNRTYTIESFERFTKNMAVKAVKPKHVEGWIASQAVSASTLRTRISDMRAFFLWCRRTGRVKQTPMLEIDTPRQPRRTPRALTVGELEELGKVLPDRRAEAMVAVMLHMGLRAAEIAGLEMSDLDLSSNLMRVVGKGKHERILPIPEIVRLWLDPYLAERGRIGGAVFRSYKTGGHLTPNSVSHLLSKWVAESGIKQGAYDGKSAHALRHTMATSLLNNGVDLRDISAALGHSSGKTTWEYLRHTSSVERLRAVMGQQIRDLPRPDLRPVPQFTPPTPLLKEERAEEAG